MCLFTVLPHVLIWARPIAQLAAIAFMLGGCSVLNGVSAGPSYGSSSNASLSFGSARYNPSTYYITNLTPRSVQKDYVDRYACASGAVLVCTCTSRVAQTCDCHC